MIEVYLNNESGNHMRFPVVPPSIGKNINADISGERVIKKGEFNLFNGKNADTISISCFFPHQDATYDFIDVKGEDPYSYVKKLENWCKTGESVRFIVTGTPINIQVMISHFEFEERDGSGDIYYILELKEDEDIEIPLWTPPAPPKKEEKDTMTTTSILHKVQSSLKPGVENEKRKDTANKTSVNKVHTVKHGEYLYLIAKKYYGNGALYKKITTNAENLKKYPSLKSSNLIYSNWKLVIP